MRREDGIAVHNLSTAIGCKTVFATVRTVRPLQRRETQKRKNAACVTNVWISVCRPACVQCPPPGALTLSIWILIRCRKTPFSIRRGIHICRNSIRHAFIHWPVSPSLPEVKIMEHYELPLVILHGAQSDVGGMALPLTWECYAVVR